MLRQFFQRPIGLSITIFVVASCVTASACLWDRDTLEMERQRFPTTLELIAGKFLRHSEAFYLWRIKDRESKLEQESRPEWFDDLAVAYEKTGDAKKAIDLMREKNLLFPGLYETHANLGTFLIHSGDFRLGLAEIEKALEINPSAHFGREEYQHQLVLYLLDCDAEVGLQLPLSEQRPNGFEPIGFASFLFGDEPGEVSAEERKQVLGSALKGVLGMMKFGNFDSPILLEALGDLLVSSGLEADAKQLAARAYLKASYEVEDPVAKEKYRGKADSCLEFQTGNRGGSTRIELSELESQFSLELEDGSNWYAQIVKDEEAWVSEGANPEMKFDQKYYDQTPQIEVASSRVSISQTGSRSTGSNRLTALLSFAAILVVPAWFIYRKLRRV